MQNALPTLTVSWRYDRNRSFLGQLNRRSHQAEYPAFKPFCQFARRTWAGPAGLWIKCRSVFSLLSWRRDAAKTRTRGRLRYFVMRPDGPVDWPKYFVYFA